MAVGSLIERLRGKAPEQLHPTEKARGLLAKAGGLRLIKEAAKSLKKSGARSILVAETTPKYYDRLGTDERYRVEIYWGGRNTGWDPERHELIILGQAVRVTTDGSSIEVDYTRSDSRFGWETVLGESLTLQEKIQLALGAAQEARTSRPYLHDMRPSDSSLYGQWRVLSFNS